MSGPCEIIRDLENAAVDLVYIHGIFGDPRSTWTKPATWKKPQCFWPGELLPNDIADARIITFGYETTAVQLGNGNITYGNILGALSFNGLKGYAESLSAGLASIRSNNISQRPIVFVAHSMGGLVVAQLIVLGDRNPSGTNVSLIAKHTKGICFLGTPFLGSDTTKWAQKLLTFLEYFGVATSGRVVGDMGRESTALVDLNENFSTVLDKRRDPESDDVRIDIAVFYETRKTKGVVIVDRDSAGPWGRIRAPIDANHDEICKFDASDQGYHIVLSALKRLIASTTLPHKKVSGSVFNNNNSRIMNQAHEMNNTYTGNINF